MKAEDFGKVENMDGTQVQTDGALDWDSVISADKEHEFILLPEGEYDFRVVGFERQHYNGGGKMKPCPMAKVSLKIETAKGAAVVFDRIYLMAGLEWKILAFFGALGMRKHGEDNFKTDWDAIMGKTGRAKVGTRQYNGKDYNEIKGYIYAEDVTPAPANTGGTAWKGGTF